MLFRFYASVSQTGVYFNSLTCLETPPLPSLKIILEYAKLLLLSLGIGIGLGTGSIYSFIRSFGLSFEVVMI